MFRRRPGDRSSGNFSVIFSRRKAKLIKIDGQGDIRSVAFFADGEHFVGGDDKGKIRRWRADDGKEVGTSMEARSDVLSIAVSQDAKWIVSGTRSGLVLVWRVEDQHRETELRGHSKAVYAVDISPDGTTVATGSDDFTARVWLLSTGDPLLAPLEHEDYLSAVKFSPNGLLIATATWGRKSVRIYDAQEGRLLVDVPIQVNSALNQSLAWASDGEQLFTLSNEGNIICLDVSTGATLSQWSIYVRNLKYPRCISLASNGTFIAASGDSSVSFWDPTTHKKIGSTINHTASIYSMAISSNFDLVMGGGDDITLRNFSDILPSRYLDIISKPAVKAQKPDAEETSRSPQARDESLDASIDSLQLIHANQAVLEAWRNDKLLEAIEILSRDKKLRDQRHLMLATRAFLRARLRQWDSAIKNARKSIAIQPTILAYVAISMARFGRGGADSAKKIFNRLFRKCHVTDVYFIILIKTLVVFTSGDHDEGLARVADLIAVCSEQDMASYRAVQIHMCLIAAKACVGRQEYDRALKLFAELQDPPQFPRHPKLECISLMFGWINDPDVFKFVLYQQRCEALYALGRQNEAAELLSTVLKVLEELSEARKDVKEWLRDFTQRCEATSGNMSNAVVNATVPSLPGPSHS